MLEHDYDTDEDCEVYFLKPVNEYNIVDKIKEANKELFDEADVAGVLPQPKRKVKFRVKLEDYEPNPSDDDNDSGAAGNERTTSQVDSEGCYEVLSLDEDIEESSERAASTYEQCAEQLAMEAQKKIDTIEIQIQGSDDEIEEICEEIMEMDMDNSQKTNTTNPNSTATASDPHHDEEPTDEIPDEDDDDKLSIIVASYLPPDPSPRDDSKATSKSHSFKRHFSFRRKNSNRRPPTSRSPEITNLKLSYKTCCEYRNAEQVKLPKYTGYMSEYGLSRDQLDKRDQSFQVKSRVVVEKNLRASEAKILKMQDNERAFTTWLKNKMRFPINRTKNMFDIKKSGNSCGNGRNGIFRSN